MAVIAATICEQIMKINQRIENKESIDTIIADMTKTSASIRFEGNGYSEEWVTEAK